MLFISSDPHAWLRPYFARLSEQPAFARLEPTMQFLLLVELVALDHPAKAAQMREWHASAQRATIRLLEDMLHEGVTAREVELWRVRKQDRELRAVAVYLPTGIDLRLRGGGLQAHRAAA